MYQPRIQTAQILAGTLTRTFELGGPDGLPDNIHVILSMSAMSGSEVLDFTGRAPGESTYISAVLATQVDIKAAESTVTTTDLSGAAPIDELLLTAQGIAAAETIDITVITW